MSERTIRRAAERKAKKLAAKAGIQSAAQQPQPTATTAATAPDTSSSSTLSDARLAANRENAQKSRGPVSDSGKAKSKLNAVTHGLTGASVLFANAEDAHRYNCHATQYQYLYQPLGPEERALVQSIIDTRWRLGTAPILEFAVIARGTAAIIESDPTFWNQPENQTDLFLEVRRQNEKELRNLQLQENRLARRCERETAQLQRLQTARKANEEYKLAQAAKSILLATHRDPAGAAKGVPIPGIGFDFSAERLDAYMFRLKPAQEQSLLQQALAEAVETTKTRSAA